jgi:glycosyltransferase involved in cell wall biosynthesis
MRVVLLSGASSIHTQRWANGLAALGVDVHVISQQPLQGTLDASVSLHIYPDRGALGYFLMASNVRKLIQKKINPDIVNAHYASGYGTTAHLVNFRPWLLSVWGSDVYDFPYKSPIHKWGVVSNLMAADSVASTSHCMATQTRRLAPRLGDIAITPFGVDCAQFSPASTQQSLKSEQVPNRPIVIGTVKTLAHKYGIDVLIKAFALARLALAQTDASMANRLRLRIVGGGPDTAELKALVAEQQISDAVVFLGNVSHAQVPDELRQLDIYAALSREESFGVAAIEAGAIGLPVVVTDAGGLPEVVVHGQTGLVVHKDNAQVAAEALLQLILSPDLRQQLGIAGRAHVLANYSWVASLKNMLAVYQTVIDQHKRKKAITK